MVFEIITALMFVIIAVIVILVLMALYYFNRFAVLSNRIDESLGQIDVQLKRRADLVPNLMETVKGYAKHEKEIMKEVTDARRDLISAKDINSKIKAGNELQTALKSIFALAENYPQLKANENFLELQKELATIEDKVAYSRQYFNDSILSYNNMVTVIPGLIFAKIYGKGRREFFMIPEEEKAVPKVKF